MFNFLYFLSEAVQKMREVIRIKEEKRKREAMKRKKQEAKEAKLAEKLKEKRKMAASFDAQEREM